MTHEDIDVATPIPATPYYVALPTAVNAAYSYGFTYSYFGNVNCAVSFYCTYIKG